MTTSKNAPPQERERPVAVKIADDLLQVTLQDRRIIATPLDWYPRLVAATPEQLANYELGLTGIYWPELDEDLSIQGMLRGNRPPHPRQTQLDTSTQNMS